jgi:hypothetical protein
VGDPRRQLAQGGHACRLHELQPGTFQLLESVGELLPLAVEFGVEPDLLHLELLRTAQAGRQRPCGRGRHHRTDLGFDGEGVLELLEADVDQLDVGGRTRGEEGLPLLGEREQPHDRSRGGMVQPELADLTGAVERHGAAEHDEEPVDGGPLMGQSGPGP